jgi:hypothetical protein
LSATYKPLKLYFMISRPDFVHEWHRHGHSHLYRLIFPANVGKQWKGMDMEYCLFNKDLRKRICECSFKSTLVPGVILWYIWNDRNDLTINGNSWSNMNLTKPTWGGLPDYDRWALQNSLKKIDKLLLAEQDFLLKFD